jgi:Zn finger protein HypA/HybF involved in hydrogenase expression
MAYQAIYKCQCGETETETVIQSGQILQICPKCKAVRFKTWY